MSGYEGSEITYEQDGSTARTCICGHKGTYNTKESRRAWDLHKNGCRQLKEHQARVRAAEREYSYGNEQKQWVDGVMSNMDDAENGEEAERVMLRAIYDLVNGETL